MKSMGIPENDARACAHRAGEISTGENGATGHWPLADDMTGAMRPSQLRHRLLCWPPVLFGGVASHVHSSVKSITSWSPVKSITWS